MKKCLVLWMFVFVLLLGKQMSEAASYQTYQEVVFLYDGTKLLEQFTSDEYKKYYNKMSGKRFWGWKTYTVQNGEPVEFVKETLFVIVNDGDTSISQEFVFAQKETVKKQYGVSGSLGIKGKGGDKKFELGLEEKLNFEANATSTTVIDEKIEIDVKIDPGTQMIVQVCGEGKVFNGVAKYYRFFRESKKGGWEVFVVTTEYFSLVKERL